MAKPLSVQLKKAKEAQLKEQAKKNISVSKKTAGQEPVAIQLGTPNDHFNKRNPYESSKFGMSIGNTLNMENYESLRVDCWLSDEVQEGESIKEAFSRVQEILEEVVEEICLAYKGV